MRVENCDAGKGLKGRLTRVHVPPNSFTINKGLSMFSWFRHPVRKFKIPPHGFNQRNDNKAKKRTDNPFIKIEKYSENGTYQGYPSRIINRRVVRLTSSPC